MRGGAATLPLLEEAALFDIKLRQYRRKLKVCLPHAQIYYEFPDQPNLREPKCAIQSRCKNETTGTWKPATTLMS